MNRYSFHIYNVRSKKKQGLSLVLLVRLLVRKSEALNNKIENVANVKLDK